MYAIRSYYEMQVFLPDCSGQVTDDIPVRPPVHRIPGRQIAVPHGKAVVVFGYGYHIPGTCPFKKLSPCVRIPVLSPEKRDKVLVAETRQFAISLS